MTFKINQPVDFEESLTCEFKEVKSQPVQSVGRVVDEYVVAFLNEAGGSIYFGIRDSDRSVTGVPINDKIRDELKQVIGQKVSVIAPTVPASMVEAPFHGILNESGDLLPGLCVLEVRVAMPKTPGLFLTGSGQAYRRTMGGTKKLSGLELFNALAGQLQAKNVQPGASSVLARLPSVHARAKLVESLLRGRRVLWVDDRPENNFYERVGLSQLGLAVDLAVSTAEGLQAAEYLKPDVIVSDMKRGVKEDAGLELLQSLRSRGINTPVVFYIARVDQSRRTPAGAFAITARADELLHYILDVLERNAG
jgi:CheY-like chemotaxis protein